MYNYKAFGLQIASELELSGLKHVEGIPDVRIRFGEVPEQLPGENKSEGILYQLNSKQFLLKVPKVAKYLVQNGNDILIDKHKGVTDDELCLFAINTPIGVLLHQRGLVPLHASAIEINGAGIVFTGVSAIGKSSLLTAFHKHGHRVLTEEICAISLCENKYPYVHPGAAYAYLWSDVLAYFKMDKSKLEHRRNNTEKFKVPLQEHFCDVSIPLKAIYILDTHNLSEIKIKELKGKDKLHPIKNNSYRKRIGNVLGNPVELFSHYTNICKNVTIKQICRPKDRLYIEELYQVIINDFKM